MATVESYDVFVVTHPYDFFVPDRMSPDPIRGAVTETDTTTALVRPSNGERSLSDPIGGEDAYDVTLEDEDGYGRLGTNAVQTVMSYGNNAAVGGCGGAQCVLRTKGSIERSGSADLVQDLTVETDIFGYFFKNREDK